jgi:hypothetical protein
MLELRTSRQRLRIPLQTAEGVSRHPVAAAIRHHACCCVPYTERFARAASLIALEPSPGQSSGPVTSPAALSRPALCDGPAVRSSAAVASTHGPSRPARSICHVSAAASVLRRAHRNGPTHGVAGSSRAHACRQVPRIKGRASPGAAPLQSHEYPPLPYVQPTKHSLRLTSVWDAPHALSASPAPVRCCLGAACPAWEGSRPRISMPSLVKLHQMESHRFIEESAQ